MRCDNADEVELDFDDILGETDSFYLLDINGGEVFIPNAKVLHIDIDRKIVVVPQAFAEEEGLL